MEKLRANRIFLGELTTEWHRYMFVHKQPLATALFPNAGVTQIRLHSFPSLVFSSKCIGTVVHAMLPRRATFKSFPAVSLALGSVVQQSFVHTRHVLAPTVIGKGRHIIKDQTCIFGIIFSGRIVGISGTPSCAIIVGQLTKGGIVTGVLLRARSGKH